MPAINKAQLGTAVESTYATPVTVTRFHEFIEESMAEARGRVEVPMLRAGQRVQRSDRFVPYNMGAAGRVSLHPLSKGFAWWLRFMLGASATTGPTDSAYTHTGTVGDLLGDAFTMQLNRPFHPADTDQAFTYAGCKVTAWELSCDVDGALRADLDIDAATVSTAVSLASASYPSGTVEPHTFIGGSVSVAGSSYDLRGIRIGCNNNLDTARRYLRTSATKKEPTENGYREVTWTLTGADFENLTTYNRFRADTAGGAVATIVATFVAPTLIGSSSLPTITVTVDAARFDTFDGVRLSADGANLQQTYSGRGLFDGTDSPVTVAVQNADSTA